MRKPAQGFTLLEVLVALVILAVGLLGLAALQVRANQAEMESYQRSQALLLANDMAHRIRANDTVPACYSITTALDAGTPFVGAGNADVFNCLGWGDLATRGRADTDIAQWQNELLGAGETLDGNNVGAMLGARGCLSYNDVTRTVTITVAWRGLTPSSDLDSDGDGIPNCRDGGNISCSCANDAYLDPDGNDYKRWLSIPIEIANLE